MLLEKKNAIVYGAGGGIGGGVARTFAREVAVLDATDERAVERTWRPWPPTPAASTSPSTSSRVETSSELHLST